VVLSDTVGFIRHLPHSLVAAFRSTLEETIQADLLLHVVDANNANRDAQVAEVNKVLEEIGAQDIPQILVLNKIDLQAAPRPDEVRASGGVLLAGDVAPGVERDDYGRIATIRLSARTGAGLTDLRAALVEIRDAEPAEMPVQEWHPLNN
jgi:GTP-binding protein HflX